MVETPILLWLKPHSFMVEYPWALTLKVVWRVSAWYPSGRRVRIALRSLFLLPQ